MTTMTQEDRIADMAEQAAFYTDADGNWYRMLYCDMDEGYFQCVDEDTGAESAVSFSDVKITGLEAFYEIKKMA